MRHVVEFPKLMEGSKITQLSTVSMKQRESFMLKPPFHVDTFACSLPCFQKFKSFAQLLCWGGYVPHCSTTKAKVKRNYCK